MNEREFRRWNEEMVARFPSVDYYERSNLLVRMIEGVRLRFLAREVASRKPGRLLEIGCGACHVLERMPARFRVGTDISSAMLAVSVKRTAGRSIHLVRAEGERLPFADASFDCVICTEVLEHVLDPEGIVAEARRVLQAGGMAIFTVPREKTIGQVKRALVLLGLDRRLFANVAEARAKGWHLHEFTLGSFRELLSGRFEIVRIKRLPVAFPVLRYAAVCRPLAKGSRP